MFPFERTFKVIGEPRFVLPVEEHGRYDADIMALLSYLRFDATETKMSVPIENPDGFTQVVYTIFNAAGHTPPEYTLNFEYQKKTLRVWSELSEHKMALVVRYLIHNFLNVTVVETSGAGRASFKEVCDLVEQEYSRKNNSRLFIAGERSLLEEARIRFKSLEMHKMTLLNNNASLPPASYAEAIARLHSDEVNRRKQLWFGFRDYLNGTGLSVPIEEWKFPTSWESKNVNYIYSHLSEQINWSLRTISGDDTPMRPDDEWEKLLAPVFSFDLDNEAYSIMESYDDGIYATVTLRDGSSINISRHSPGHYLSFAPRDNCACELKQYIEAGIEISRQIESSSYKAWRQAEKLFGKNGTTICIPESFKHLEKLGELLQQARIDLTIDVEDYEGKSADSSKDNTLQILDEISNTQAEHTARLNKIDATVTRTEDRLKKKQTKTKVIFSTNQQDGIYTQWEVARKRPEVMALCEGKATYEAAFKQFGKEFRAYGANNADDIRRALRARSERIRRKGK